MIPRWLDWFIETVFIPFALLSGMAMATVAIIALAWCLAMFVRGVIVQ